jgi:hypothetical protein
MIHTEFRTNRASFSRSQLEKYRGLWIAFDASGTRIIASGESLDEADQQVRMAGEDPNEVVFERVPGIEDDDCSSLTSACSAPT